MIAPSEKHLEDWIAQNGMPEIVPQVAMYDILIGRQVRLPHGIADLIYTDHVEIRIVELKKGELTLDALTQAIRYKSDLQRMWDFYTDTRPPLFEKPPYPGGVPTGHGNPPINVVLVGHVVSDAALAICDGIGVWVWLYEYDAETDSYEFDFACPSTTGQAEAIYQLPNLAQAMKQIYINRRRQAGLPLVGMNLKGQHWEFESDE